MELTEREKELLAGFAATKPDEFVAFAEEALGERAMHALAEKIGLDQKS